MCGAVRGWGWVGGCVSVGAAGGALLCGSSSSRTCQGHLSGSIWRPRAPRHLPSAFHEALSDTCLPLQMTTQLRDMLEQNGRLQLLLEDEERRAETDDISVRRLPLQ